MKQHMRFAGLAVAAAAVLTAPSSKAVGCTEDSSYDGVPFEVDGSGQVTAIDGRRFTIGDVTFEMPSSRSRRQWCLGPDERDDEMLTYDRFRVGDWIEAGGSLRQDGTVLAYWTYLSDAGAEDDPSALIASGVVESVDGDFESEFTGTFVVNGVTYRLDPNGLEISNSHEFLQATDPVTGEDLPFDSIAAGDTAFVTYHLSDSGDRLASYVFVRMSGSESRLAGTITAVWADGTEFAVDGVPAVCDDATQLVYRDPADWGEIGDPESAGDNFEGLAVGQIVDLTGVLRDGVVFGDRLVVVREPGSPGAKRLARRAGRLRARGVLDGVEADGTIVVEGLAVKTRGRVARSVLKSAPAPLLGRRVDVDASVRDGVIVASTIRRR